MPGEWQTDTDIHSIAETMATDQATGQEAEPSSRSFSTYRTANGGSTLGGGRTQELRNGASLKPNGIDRASPVSSSGSGERDPFSQLAFLRAEEILANAKKRLTVRATTDRH